MSDGCILPEDLYYWIDKHVWAKPEPDGTVLVGMTDVAQSLAGKIIVVNLRSLGKNLARGKSAGTLESGKWVGTIPTPVAGKVIAINEQIKGQPDLVNTDPYGAGWLIRVEPADWNTDSQNLATGADGVAEYRKKLEAEGIKCSH
ncbi:MULTISPECIES: glycine cleavage system protein H [Kyrpidia]|uniref:Glycine cleavage system H protein 2 n=2 Tax=Kyrpidia spormannii TaxID=2055160 RepID=A0ACA8ZD46_9BACL|nr:MULTISPECIES: glycine cleavage system protein GcvH [Kyrpidia]HHY68323.1 glycine cleavage system protein GcvH [Alicyclobacillus sp.]MBE3551816.1 glycine cleavage system protein GcvH [Kyrpidia tusciae]MCL6575178.1 glycine cleavage system protein GcvH [Kyrpidia sp.]CAB3394091.1 Glycine cleavage system H protein 2 [Kyrpidia spormannii]CAB3395027.1 Glycine cleavage system H protein 2 [Kyrpidia spormannii]